MGLIQRVLGQDAESVTAVEVLGLSILSENGLNLVRKAFKSCLYYFFSQKAIEY
jgi:hypothetical protein